MIIIRVGGLNRHSQISPERKKTTLESAAAAASMIIELWGWIQLFGQNSKADVVVDFTFSKRVNKFDSKMMKIDAQSKK